MCRTQTGVGATENHTRLRPLPRCLDEALEQVERTFERTTLGMVLNEDAQGEWGAD